MEAIIRDKRKGGPKKPSGPRINDMIRIPECRLIGHDGHQYGVVQLDEARRISEMQGLDLVEVSPNARPPVVKIIDYGKFKYEQQKKANEAKKKTVAAQLKEIQFRPNIETHDLETKLKRGQKFLLQGDKVKMVMQFRGREMSFKEIGKEKFTTIIQMLVDYGAVIESPGKMMGNRIITIIAPDKKVLARRQKEEESSPDKSEGEQTEIAESEG